MQETIVIVAGMVSVVIIEIGALIKGYNGRILAGAMVAIGLLAGVKLDDIASVLPLLNK